MLLRENLDAAPLWDTVRTIGDTSTLLPRFAEQLTKSQAGRQLESGAAEVL